jgi:uncharacterized protein DUF3352
MLSSSASVHTMPRMDAVPRRRRRPRRLLGLLALAPVVALAACGSSTTSAPSTVGGVGGPDPTTITPRDALVAGAVIVRPNGTLKVDATAAARRVLHASDPGRKVRQLLDKALAKDHETFARDVDPWLGRQIGFFVLIPAKRQADASGTSKVPGSFLVVPLGGGPKGAFVFAVRDRAALQRVLARRRADRLERRAGTYRGVSYDLDTEDGSREAAVGDFYVEGDLPALRAAIDTWKGGDALAGSDRYRAAVGSLDPQRLAFAYADPHALQPLLAGIPSPRLRRLLGGIAKSHPLTATLTARADALTLDLSGHASGKQSAPSDAGGVALAALPADAWLALAAPLDGASVARGLQRLAQRGIVPPPVRAALGFGLNDLLGNLRGLAGFVRGTTRTDVGGGLLLGMRDAATAQRALTNLQDGIAGLGLAPTHALRLGGAGGFLIAIPHVPQPIVVLGHDRRIAAGYGPVSARVALDPPRRLGDSAGGRAAIASLGSGFSPWFVLQVGPVLQLAQAFGAGRDASYRQALPYLQAYRSLAIGSRRDGDRFTLRVVAALQDSPGGSAP